MARDEDALIHARFPHDVRDERGTHCAALSFLSALLSVLDVLVEPGMTALFGAA
jgi:hypothetical protein